MEDSLYCTSFCCFSVFDLVRHFSSISSSHIGDLSFSDLSVLAFFSFSPRLALHDNILALALLLDEDEYVPFLRSVVVLRCSGIPCFFFFPNTLDSVQVLSPSADRDWFISRELTFSILDFLYCVVLLLFLCEHRVRPFFLMILRSTNHFRSGEISQRSWSRSRRRFIRSSIETRQVFDC